MPHPPTPSPSWERGSGEQQLSPAEPIEAILEQHILILQLQAQVAPLQAQIKHRTGPDKEGGGRNDVRVTDHGRSAGRRSNRAGEPEKQPR